MFWRLSRPTIYAPAPFQPPPKPIAAQYHAADSAPSLCEPEPDEIDIATQVAKSPPNIATDKPRQIDARPLRKPEDELTISRPEWASPRIANQKSERARRKLLTKSDSKDIYKGEPLLNTGSATTMISKLAEQLADLKDNAINAEMTELRNILVPNVQTQPITFEQWAKLSLHLERLMHLLEPYRGRKSFIFRNVEFMEFASRYMWMQMAHEKLVALFGNELAELGRVNPTYNKLRTTKFSAEASTPIPMVQMSVGLEASTQDNQYFDDEGYFITSKVKSLSIALNFKALIAKLTGQGTYSRGSYNYSRFATAHARCNFGDLLEENKNVPAIASLISRKAVASGTADLFNNTDELADFYAVQKEYVQKGELIAQSFSLFLTLDYSGRATRKSNHDALQGRLKKEQAAIDDLKEQQRLQQTAPAPLPVLTQDEKDRKLEARIGELQGSKAKVKHVIGVEKAYQDRKAVLLRGESEIRTGTVKATAGLDESFLQCNVSGSIEWSKKKTKATRYATFCQLLDDKNSKAGVKEKLIKSLKENGRKIGSQLNASSWGDIEPHSVSRYEGEPGEDFDARVLKHEELMAQFRERRESYQQRLTIFSNGLYETDHQLFTEKFTRPYGSAEPEDVNFEIQSRMDETLQNKLIADFACYTNLHAQCNQSSVHDDSAIQAFHLQYGVKTTEECLQKMAVMTAYFYSLIMDKTDDASKARKDKLSTLEANIHSTGIPHNPDVLRDKISASQHYFIKTDDKTIQGTFKAGGAILSGLGLSLAMEIGFKIVKRKLLHFNPLRCGEYLTFEFGLTADDAFNQKFLTYLSSRFGHLGIPDLSDAILKGDAATKSLKGVYTIKLFKPDGVDNAPRIELFKRLSAQTGFEFNPKIHIPIPGITTLTLGYSNSGSDSYLLHDSPSPKSMIFFATQYLHAVFTGKIKINAATGAETVTNQETYWHVLMDKHKSVMQELMQNFATPADRHANELTALEIELEFIKKRFLNYASLEKKRQVDKLISELQDAANKFKAMPIEENYKAAINCFKLLVYGVYDPWMQTRERSAAYADWRYEFGSAD